jgi:hypothetical protein
MVPNERKQKQKVCESVTRWVISGDPNQKISVLVSHKRRIQARHENTVKFMKSEGM